MANERWGTCQQQIDTAPKPRLNKSQDLSGEMIGDQQSVNVEAFIDQPRVRCEPLPRDSGDKQHLQIACKNDVSASNVLSDAFEIGDRRNNRHYALQEHAVFGATELDGANTLYSDGLHRVALEAHEGDCTAAGAQHPQATMDGRV